MMAVRGKQLSESDRVWLDGKGEPINIDRAWSESDRQIGLSRRAQALLAAAGMDGPEAQWFVLRIERGADIAVDNALADARIERWMPAQMMVPPRRGGRKGPKSEAVAAPSLPGYIFVRLVSVARSWAGLRTIKGIAGVLGGADRPAPIRDGIILKLRAFIDEDPRAIEVLTNALKTGDQVRIDDGPFASFPGVVEEVRERGRVLVEAMIFGRACPIELDLAQVSKLD